MKYTVYPKTPVLISELYPTWVILVVREYLPFVSFYNCLLLFHTLLPLSNDVTTRHCYFLPWCSTPYICR